MLTHRRQTTGRAWGGWEWGRGRRGVVGGPPRPPCAGSCREPHAGPGPCGTATAGVGRPTACPRASWWSAGDRPVLQDYCSRRVLRQPTTRQASPPPPLRHLPRPHLCHPPHSPTSPSTAPTRLRPPPRPRSPPPCGASRPSPRSPSYSPPRLQASARPIDRPRGWSKWRWRCRVGVGGGAATGRPPGRPATSSRALQSGADRRGARRGATRPPRAPPPPPTPAVEACHQGIGGGGLRGAGSGAGWRWPAQDGGPGIRPESFLPLAPAPLSRPSLPTSSPPPRPPLPPTPQPTPPPKTTA